MGSCLSGDVASARALPYALAAAAAVTASTSASDVGSGNKSGNSRKKMRKDTSFDTKLEMWLHRVPERLFLNGSSEVASLFSKQGKKGINQDAMIVWEMILMIMTVEIGSKGFIG
ncbi:probable protein phosphatase 2C 33 isoform X1 [Juglans regia]|uniref:Probable protein phosphatase 2C 33 isoform X1 n=1 Tax=Juglans regia TaxID=51240 RepID=A0A6P9F0W0_JUGRE|nr:probable protein phosphatase 2C 33 isoform X1 [Juglans regia]